jgi:hypothetical protein
MIEFDNLDIVLDKGIVINQCCDSCPPCEYIMGSKSVYLEYVESVGLNYGCCLNYVLRETDYTDCLDLCVLYKSADTINSNVYTNYNWCGNAFSGCLESLETTVGTTNFNSILDLGIIEQERTFGVNGICFILDYLDEKGVIDQNEITDIFIKILTNGLIIRCVSDRLLVVSSISTYKNFAEAIGYTQGFVSNSSLNPNCN